MLPFFLCWAVSRVDFGGDLEKKFYFCTNCELKVVIVVLITVKSGVAYLQLVVCNS
jgi:hypothetical protein